MDRQHHTPIHFLLKSTVLRVQQTSLILLHPTLNNPNIIYKVAFNLIFYFSIHILAFIYIYTKFLIQSLQNIFLSHQFIVNQLIHRFLRVHPLKFLLLLSKNNLFISHPYKMTSLLLFNLIIHGLRLLHMQSYFVNIIPKSIFLFLFECCMVSWQCQNTNL